MIPNDLKSAIIRSGAVEITTTKRGGVPVLKGTRFTLAQLLAEISEGRSVQELAADFDLDIDIIKSYLESLAAYFDRPATGIQ